MARAISALLSACILGLTGTASAETLGEALGIAEASNPQLDIERTNQQIAEEQLIAARGARLPTVEFTGQYGPETIQTNRAIVLDQGGRQIGTASLSAVQPLYAGGRIRAGIREAQASIGSSAARLDAATQDTILQAVTAYVDVRQDREAIKIQQNSVSLLTEQLRASRDRFDVGEITRTDVALAEARLEGARASLAAAEAQARASEASYQIIIGRDPGNLVAPPPISVVPSSFDEALAIALDESPDIAEAEFGERAAEQRVRSVRSRLLPELNVVVSAAFQGTLNQEDTVNPFGPDPTTPQPVPDFLDRSVSAFAQARIPLYQGGVARSQVRSAKLERAQAQLNIEAVRRQTIANVSQSWASYQAALIGIEASRRQVEAAEIAYEGGQEELSVGVRTTLDVLDQEQDLLEARLSLVQSERDAYVAASQLFRAMGTLSPRRYGF
ncbi:MAG: TolC family outer membrane protein [Pseudomonadota bacterium]